MDLLQVKTMEIPKGISTKQFTAEEITRAYLEQIKRDDTDVNAYITVMEEEAISQAKKVDEKIAQKEPLGVLAGIPISIKDNIAVKDVKMTCASKMLDNYVSPYDATIIKKIKQEDGIIIGKVNMDEFAMGLDTKTSYYGPSKNPLDLTRVAGGSSGGSAASVASSEAVLSVGTDTGGSSRQPAAFCGIVGMKPTYGSISRYGISTMANTFDQPGVLGASVEDVALLLKVLEGADKKDATSIGNEKLKNVLFSEEETNLQGKKFAIPVLYAEQKVDEDIGKAFEKAKEYILQAGGEVSLVDMKSLTYSIATYHILVNGEISANMSRFDGLRYGYRTENYETIDDLYIKSRSEAFGNEVKRRIMIGTHILTLEHSKEYYEKAMKIRSMIIQDFQRVFETFDFVMSPTYPVKPYLVSDDMDPVKQYAADIFTVPVNIAGLPAISVPLKLDDGLYAGIQFIANQFEDAKLLNAALAFERVVE